MRSWRRNRRVKRNGQSRKARNKLSERGAWGGVTMESWRLVWRDGFVPVLSTAGLESLRDALRGDDPRLTQGSTTTPPPLMCVQDWPVEAACALGFCGWQGDDLETVGEVEEFFARVCFEADQRLGEPAACRWFLNWFDDTPRDEMRRELLAEVEKALADRMPLNARARPIEKFPKTNRSRSGLKNTETSPNTPRRSKTLSAQEFAMFEVIICTISSGRVQRKQFDNWDAAWKCADAWKAKNTNRRTYAVSLERATPTVQKQTGRSSGM